MQRVASAKHSIASDSFLSRISRQGRNYSTLVVWTLYTGFEGRAAKLAGAIILSLLHLGSQAAGIYAIYWYGRQMEHSGLSSVPYLNIEVNLNNGATWLWGFVIFSTACFLISAAFLYLARRQILNIVEQHYARKLEELVLQSFRLPDSRVRLASKLLQNFGVMGLSSGCQDAAIIAISFAYATTAVVGGIGAAAFLFWSAPSLTILVLFCAGLGTLFLYPLTLRAAQSAKDREKVRLAFKKEFVNLAERSSNGETVQSVKSADKLAREFLMRRRVGTEIVFAIQIGITLILAVVVYYMASEALAGKERWVVFIAYIAALRMMLTGIAQPIRAFAAVSRFYPQMVRYYLFARDMEKIDERHYANIQQGDTIVLGSLATGVEVTAKVGDCLALVTHERVRDMQFAFLDAKRPNSEAPLASIVVEPPKRWPSDASIILIDSTKLARDDEQLLTQRNALSDKVMLIVYQQGESAGMFGEEHVITFFDGKLQGHALLGSQEAGAALQEFDLGSSKQRMDKGLVDDGLLEDAEI